MQLRQINGIGVKTEQRLREHGVTTLASLAGADPAVILGALGDQRGMSEEIVRSWIATARRLLDAAEIDEPRAPRAAEAEIGGDDEWFRLGVSVDASSGLCLTRIVHDGSGSEASWPRWPGRQLEAFVRDRAGAARDERADRTRDSRCLAIDLGPRPGGATRAITGFVDPDDLEVTGPTPYRASGIVTELGSSEVRRTGEVQGVAEPGVPLRLDFGALALPHGLHRLVARVELFVAVE